MGNFRFFVSNKFGDLQPKIEGLETLRKSQGDAEI
jgi:hypothetical protein